MAKRVVSNMACADKKSMSVGHTICVSNEGFLYSFGKSEYQAHGHKDKGVVSPKQIPLLNNIESVCCGSHHTICLNTDGQVFTFGCCDRLGVGIIRKTKYLQTKELLYTHKPQKVELPPIKQISCGIGFSICLSEDGTLYSFGDNAYGQLGIGNTVLCSTPQKIDLSSKVEFVECGAYHVFCKVEENKVLVWGRNNYGQLGLGHSETQYSPIQCEDVPDDIVDIKCGNEHTLLLTSNQEVYSCGTTSDWEVGGSSSVFQQILDLSNIIRIECGESHSMCIDINNDLFIFGDSLYGQLGRVMKSKTKYKKHPKLSNIMDISKGGMQTFIKTFDNKIYAFGKNEFSQLGIKTKDYKKSKPIRVFKDNEDIWYTSKKSSGKSARFLPDS